MQHIQNDYYYEQVKKSIQKIAVQSTNLSPEIKQQFIDLYNMLTPENAKATLENITAITRQVYNVNHYNLVMSASVVGGVCVLWGGITYTVGYCFDKDYAKEFGSIAMAFGVVVAVSSLVKC